MTQARRKFVPVPKGVTPRSELISTGAAARILRRPIRDLEAMVARGRGPDVHRGPLGEMLFRRREVEEWSRNNSARYARRREVRTQEREAARREAEAKGFISSERGVDWDTESYQWRARLRWDGAKRTLGRFDDEREAIDCIREARRLRAADVTFDQYRRGDYDVEDVSTREFGAFPVFDDEPVFVPTKSRRRDD